MAQFDGRVAMVTGASRGIGRAVAFELAQKGARIIAAARSEGALKTLASKLPGSGHEVVVVDLLDRESIARASERALELGPIDFLINNAGIAESAPYRRSSDEMWDRIMQVNAGAVHALCRAIVPSMVKRKRGRVVMVASNAGLTGYIYSSVYCASKHAIIGYMKAVALEIAESGVTINAVCPGWVNTEMARKAVERIAEKTGQPIDVARDALTSMSPQKRMVEPEEVAHLVSMLCEDASGGMHGQALALDGGQVMR